VLLLLLLVTVISRAPADVPPGNRERALTDESARRKDLSSFVLRPPSIMNRVSVLKLRLVAAGLRDITW
jgi:hypothetical protein